MGMFTTLILLSFSLSLSQAFVGYPNSQAGSHAFTQSSSSINSLCSKQYSHRVNKPISTLCLASKEDSDSETSSTSVETKESLFPERLNMIYDSKCSVCRWEIEFLDAVQKSNQRKQRHHQQQLSSILPLRFTDLEERDSNDNSIYDSTLPANGGITYARGMKGFHAVKPDGTVLYGIPVFREAYDLVGLGWFFKWTVDVPWMGKIADGVYDVFATYRTDVTRGSSVLDLIRKYDEEKSNMGERGEEDGGVGCKECEEKLATLTTATATTE